MGVGLSWQGLPCARSLLEGKGSPLSFNPPLAPQKRTPSTQQITGLSGLDDARQAAGQLQRTALPWQTRALTAAVPRCPNFGHLRTTLQRLSWATRYVHCDT